MYEINGPYFFGIATKFEEVMAQLGDRPKVRIIRMRKVPFIDSTGIHNLESLCKMSQKEKITVVLSGVNTKVHQVLEKADFYTLLGKENICPNINVALERAHKLVDDPAIANRLSLITGKDNRIVMAKRKNSKKQSQGVIYLIVLACLALICREPIAHALQDKLPVIKERITQKSNTRHHRKPPCFPPPLKKRAPNRYCTARAISLRTTANTRYPTGWHGN